MMVWEQVSEWVGGLSLDGGCQQSSHNIHIGSGPAWGLLGRQGVAMALPGDMDTVVKIWGSVQLYDC